MIAVYGSILCQGVRAMFKVDLAAFLQMLLMTIVDKLTTGT